MPERNKPMGHRNPAHASPKRLAPLAAYAGPNPYARDPVLVFRLARVPYEGDALWRRRTATEQAFPGALADCPETRDLEPTHALALMLAHVARWLLNRRRGCVHSAGAVSIGANGAILWVGYHEPGLAAAAVGLAREALAASATAPFPAPMLAAKIEAFLQRCRVRHPDYIARVLMLAAAAAGLPVLRPSSNDRYVQYGQGVHARRLFEASGWSDPAYARALCRDKAAALRYLGAQGYPVAEHLPADSPEAALRCAQRLGWPVVVKPADRGQGRGVSVGITSAAALAQAFQHARRHTRRPILVERCVPGDDHRLLVVHGRLLAATRREPAAVTGDGESTIRALVDRLNRGRAADPVLARYLKQVDLADPLVIGHLRDQGYDVDACPEAGRRVTLRGNANVSTGGTPTDVTARVHPAVRAMAEAIAHDLGLQSLGIDYLTTDIGRPWQEVPGCIIELNDTPGLDLHIAAGMPEIDLGRAILGPGLGRIPVVVVVAPTKLQGEMIDALLAAAESLPSGLALVGPDAVILADLRLAGARDVHERMGQALALPATRAVVGFMTPEELLRRGFLIDRCELAVLAAEEDFADRVRPWLEPLASRVLDRRGVGTSAAADDLGGFVREVAAAIARPVANPAAPARPDSGASGKIRMTWPAGEVDLTVLKPRGLTPGPALFTMMRNEAYLCPYFFDHYRRLGIENFVVYEDHSTDATLDYLCAQPDTLVLTSGIKYQERMANGKAFHQNLVNWVPESLGPERWVLYVDADEFLFLPEDFASVEALYRWLDARGHTSALAAMVDFYPRCLGERNVPGDVSPFQASPYFDVDKAFRRPTRPGEPFVKLPGGIRARLQAMLKAEDPACHDRIYKGRGYKMASTWKTPFIKTGTGTYRVNSHGANRFPPLQIGLALAHFKFHPGLDRIIEDALHLNNHYLDSIEYRFLQAVIERFETRDLRHAGSRRFTGPDSLVEAGFIHLDLEVPVPG